jgi:hypothetical protein
MSGTNAIAYLASSLGLKSFIIINFGMKYSIHFLVSDEVATLTKGLLYITFSIALK